MGRYLQGPDGRMTGSIGDGKDKVPTAIPAPAQPRTLPADREAADRVAAYYEAWKNPAAATSRVTLEDANGYEREFDAGDLEAAAHHLTNGNCHNLAAALHEATGYPIVLFYSDGSDWYNHMQDDEDEDEDHIRHVAVLTPDGYVLDGHGSMKLTTVMARCGWESEILDGGVEKLSERLDIDAIQHSRIWQELDATKAASFVTPVLKTYRSED